MKHLLTILTLLTLISCKEDKTPVLVKPANTADTIKTVIQSHKVFIKNKSLYPKAWVADMQMTQYPSDIKVIDDYVVTEGDTIPFPDDLVLNKDYVFLATKGKLDYELKVKRINPVVLQYSFTLFDNKKTVFEQSGEAYIGVLFFLASEIDEDDVTGTAYEASEYGHSYNDQCEFIMRIGEPDEKGKLRATVKQLCENETQNKDININVTLREHIE
jgi:hypothetical protein